MQPKRDLTMSLRNPTSQLRFRSGAFKSIVSGNKNRRRKQNQTQRSQLSLKMMVDQGRESKNLT